MITARTHRGQYFCIAWGKRRAGVLSLVYRVLKVRAVCCGDSYQLASACLRFPRSLRFLGVRENWLISFAWSASEFSFRYLYTFVLLSDAFYSSSYTFVLSSDVFYSSSYTLALLSDAFCSSSEEEIIDSSSSFSSSSPSSFLRLRSKLSVSLPPPRLPPPLFSSFSFLFLSVCLISNIFRGGLTKSEKTVARIKGCKN